MRVHKKELFEADIVLTWDYKKEVDTSEAGRTTNEANVKVGGDISKRKSVSNRWNLWLSRVVPIVVDRNVGTWR